MTSPSDRRVTTAIGDRASRRAIVCFVEDDRHLIQQVLALRHSWLYAQSPDTDLVVIEKDFHSIPDACYRGA